MRLYPKYNASIIILSFAIAFLGSYLAISLCEQLRTSYLHGDKNNYYVRMKWLVYIGISLGGVGIWCMHFIGMSSLELTDPNSGEVISMGYEALESLFSLVIVIIMGIIGLVIASNDRMFAKSKEEILEMFVQDHHHLSMVEIKRTKDSKIIWLISTKDLWTLLLGGFVAGGGVCVMHYMGMAAMEFHQRIVIRWNPGIVFISCMVAIIAASAAFWILFRLLSIFPRKEGLRIASAVVMAIAVCGMHYLGMQAAEFNFSPDADHTLTENHLPKNNLIPVVIVSMGILWLLVIGLLIDLRQIIFKYRSYILLKQAHSDFQGSYLGSIMKESNNLALNKVKPIISNIDASGGGGGIRSSILVPKRYSLTTIEPITESNTIDPSHKIKDLCLDQDIETCSRS